MKTCVIYGSMGAERTSDQYPTVNLCDDCYSDRRSKGADSEIVVKEATFDPDFGDCDDCGKSATDEAHEQS